MSSVNILGNARGLIRARLLLFQLWTWRLTVEGREAFDTLVRNGDRFILCFWHGKYTPILPIMRGFDGCVFTSATRKGDIIASIVRNFGFRCTQIPDRGGQRSMQLMKDALSEARAAGTAVDGPLGPYHRVKHGVVRLASELGYLLLPISVDARGKWVLEKRWDLMEIPYPFTRVCLVIGEPIAVPSLLGPEGIAAWSSRLGKALDSLDARAARLVREKRR
ncbi:MAG: DUF374 domain-containing protein [bacterium]|nr:MAG: DUF374 domain-containing protein [bacterium]